MNIKEYLFVEDIANAELARRCGIRSNLLYLIKSGRCLPSLKTMQKLIYASNGKITIDDVISFYEKGHDATKEKLEKYDKNR